MQKDRTLPFTKADWSAMMFLLACFLLLGYLIISASQHILDGDSSGELALANLLAKENAIISRNWFYSTELRVLNTQLIYAPLFKLFDSWRTVRIVGALLLNALLVGSYLFMMRQTAVSRKSRLFSAGLLLLPISVAQARIVNLHTYYIPHIAIGFTLIGLLLAYKNHGKGAVTLIAFLVLCFLSGLGGVRQLMVTLAPLALALLYQAFLCPVEGEGSTLKKSLLSFAHTKPLMLGVYGLMANISGMLINLTIFEERYSFGDQIKTHFAELSVYRVTDTINAFSRLLGFRQGSRLFSQMGILSLLAVGMALLLLIYSVKVLLQCRLPQKANPSDDHATFLWIFFASSFVVNTLLFVLTDAFFYELYYLPLVILIVPLAATLMDRYTTPARVHQQVIAWFFVGCLMLNSAYSMKYLFQRPREASVIEYGGLTYQNIHLADDLQAPLAYLNQHGYKQGYATFWHANVVRELSNGEIVCTGINFPDMSIYPWLLGVTEAEPMPDRGASFLLLSVAEYRENPNHAIYQRTSVMTDNLSGGTITDTPSPPGQVVYSDDHFVIIGFEDDNRIQRVLHN